MGPNALFSLYRDAFRTLAKTSPSEAESRLDRLNPTLHKVLLHLHLETIAVNSDALGHRLEALLDEQHLFSAGLGRIRMEIVCQSGSVGRRGEIPPHRDH